MLEEFTLSLSWEVSIGIGTSGNLSLFSNLSLFFLSIFSVNDSTGGLKGCPDCVEAGHGGEGQRHKCGGRSSHPREGIPPLPPERSGDCYCGPLICLIKPL